MLFLLSKENDEIILIFFERKQNAAGLKIANSDLRLKSCQVKFISLYVRFKNTQAGNRETCHIISLPAISAFSAANQKFYIFFLLVHVPFESLRLLKRGYIHLDSEGNNDIS